MNDGTVSVKLDGKKLEEMSEALRDATVDAVRETVKAGPLEAAPPSPAPKAAAERGVRHTVKYLPCVLTPKEVAELHIEISRDVADADDAERRVERIKEDAKAEVAAATNAAKAKRTALADKARTVREGKLHRDVGVTVRIDWHARTKTTTRDDTGEVLDVEPATSMEVADCGTWETDLPAGKSYLRAPDGAVLDQRDLTDAERQTKLPLADGGAAPAEPAKADRAWVALGTWEDLDADTAERFIKPDPHGKAPAIGWTEQGKYMVAAIPAGLRPQLDHHATQAGVLVFYGDAEPTLADLAAQSKEPPSKPRKGAAKKGRAS